MNTTRIQRVLENLSADGLSQALITDPLSIWYLTGYYTEPYERFLALYLAQDSSAAAGFRTTLFCNRLFPDASGFADQIVAFDDTEDPIALVSDVAERDMPLGIDKELSARWLLPLMDAGVATSFALASAAVDAARSVKDGEEQEFMRAASRVNDEAMGWLVAQVREGVAKREIAAGLLGEYRRLGAEGHAFTPIVSFGPNAADPHHEPDGTVFHKGDMVLFDVGCKRRAYCSDMTRTFFSAEPTARQLEVYEAVRRANEAAEAIVRPGVTFAQIDLTARRVIEEAGFGPYFTHRLGHQIGLTDHEPGDVSSTHDEAVRPGQCFSIEPGIYLPGEMGVRIEDLVIVDECGCEVLNSYPKGPTVLSV